MGIGTIVKNVVARLIPGHEISGSDTVVLLVGPAGAGKSSFINIAAGRDVMEIGHGLAPCTLEVKAVACSHPWSQPSRRIVFVDTPGLDNTTVYEIKTLIAKWMKASLARKHMIAGILYIYPITTTRITQVPPLTIFEKFCGGSLSRKVLLVTTMWGEIDYTRGILREKDLREYWHQIVAQGSEVPVVQFQKTPESAWNVIDRLLQLRSSL